MGIFKFNKFFRQLEMTKTCKRTYKLHTTHFVGKALMICPFSTFTCCTELCHFLPQNSHCSQSTCLFHPFGLFLTCGVPFYYPFWQKRANFLHLGMIFNDWPTFALQTVNILPKFCLLKRICRLTIFHIMQTYWLILCIVSKLPKCCPGFAFFLPIFGLQNKHLSLIIDPFSAFSSWFSFDALKFIMDICVHLSLFQQFRSKATLHR